MRKLLLLLLSILLVTACKKETEKEKLSEEIASSANRTSTKINVCHYDAVTNKWKIININLTAWPEHQTHGDVRLDDADSDGYVPSNACGFGQMGDCNDNNATIHPGALEICNEIDENCNGQIDENCNAPEDPTIAVDPISSEDAAILASIPNTTNRLEDVYLDNGESVKDFLLREDPDFLQLRPSMRTTTTGPRSPAEQFRLYVARMTDIGNELIADHHFDAGAAANEPEQTKIAYNAGSKDYIIRRFATAGACRYQKLYGLDCSGMIYVMTTASKLPEVVPKNNFNVDNTSDVSKWNTAFLNSNDYKDLSMEDLGQTPLSNIKQGDMVIWPSAPHVGFVINGSIYMSNGSWELPNCANNINKGPCAKLLSQGWLNSFGGGVYKIFRIKAAGTTADLNGQNYNTVNIGGQVWMKENLNTSKYRNGDPIPQVTDPTQWANLTTGAWCYYNNVSANGITYGKLYNWYAINDPRGLAPNGWHVPSDAEWTTLSDYLGGAAVAGTALKSASGWYNNGNGANSSGFTGLPGGLRWNDDGVNDPGIFFYLTMVGYWWSSSEYTPFAMTRHLVWNGGHIGSGNFSKQFGMSVRCVKD